MVPGFEQGSATRLSSCPVPLVLYSSHYFPFGFQALPAVLLLWLPTPRFDQSMDFSLFGDVRGVSPAPTSLYGNKGGWGMAHLGGGDQRVGPGTPGTDSPPIPPTKQTWTLLWH